MKKIKYIKTCSNCEDFEMCPHSYRENEIKIIGKDGMLLLGDIDNE